MSGYQELHNKLVLATSARDRRAIAAEAVGLAQAAVLTGLQSPAVDADTANALLDNLLHATATLIRVVESPRYTDRASEVPGYFADMVEPSSYRDWVPDESLTPKVFTAVVTLSNAGHTRLAKTLLKLHCEGVTTTQRTPVLFVTGSSDDVRKAVEFLEQHTPPGDPEGWIVDSSMEEGIITELPGRTEREGTMAYKASIRFASEQKAKWAYEAAKIARPDFAARVQYLTLVFSGPDMESVAALAQELKFRFGGSVELWQGKELPKRRKWGI